MHMKAPIGKNCFVYTYGYVFEDRELLSSVGYGYTFENTHWGQLFLYKFAMQAIALQFLPRFVTPRFHSPYEVSDYLNCYVLFIYTYSCKSGAVNSRRNGNTNITF